MLWQRGSISGIKNRWWKASGGSGREGVDFIRGGVGGVAFKAPMTLQFRDLVGEGDKRLEFERERQRGSQR